VFVQGIFNAKVQKFVPNGKVDIDFYVPLLFYSVLEAILYKRQKDQGRNFHLVDVSIDVDLRFHTFPVAEFLQLEVTVEVVDRFEQADTRLLDFVKHILHDLRELHDDVGCIGRLFDHQGIEVIQGIEKEMRLNLGFEKIELRLQVDALQLVIFPFFSDPVIGEFDGRNQGYDINGPDHHLDNVNQRERLLVALGLGPEVFRYQQVVQAASNHIENKQADDEIEKELEVFLLEDKPGNQKINGEIRNDDVQWKLDQVGFQGVPVILVDARKAEEIENEIHDPEEDVKSHRNPEL
jgi:hypothetical protein